MEVLVDNKKIKCMPILTDRQKKIFWSKIPPFDNPFMCWEWQRPPEKNGYGITNINGSNFKAHRLSYYLSFGDIPKGLLVLHKCDNRKCINPNHLFIGTTQDNAIDMINKGRGKVECGENHWANRHPEKVKRGETSGTSKLNNKIVNEIRSIGYSHGGKLKTYRILALQFNISETNIRRVLKRQIWQHI